MSEHQAGLTGVLNKLNEEENVNEDGENDLNVLKTSRSRVTPEVFSTNKRAGESGGQPMPHQRFSHKWFDDQCGFAMITRNR